MKSRDQSAGRGPKLPGVVYMSIVTVLSVFVGAIAITPRQTPPPTIAEYAPQSSELITEAPTDQSSELGGGRGGGGFADEACANLGVCPDDPPDPIDVPRVRRCVGDPPRQIEDPQSPPCVPYWDGDNGGATSKGVTRDEIRIAQPINWDPYFPVQAFVAFFNSRFEFYGRKIVLLPFDQSAGYSGPSGMLSDAAKVDEELDALASLAYDPNVSGGADFYYYDELARRGIVSVNSWPTILTSDHYRKFAPYQWNVLMAMDESQRHLGEWICKGLKDRPPAYAGPVESSAEKRTFGIIQYQTEDGTKYHIATLVSILQGCGIQPLVVSIKGSSDAGATEAAATNAVLQLKQQEITSVVAVINGQVQYKVVYPVAQAQDFHPEWLVPGLQQDTDDQGQQAPPGQAENRIGLTFNNKFLQMQEMPWWWAYSEMSPGASTTDASAYGWYGGAHGRYTQMLLLASGIQMAGPNLTPETFQTGLQRAVFPNPNAGLAPLYQGRVGFGGRSHTMIKDGAAIWWNQAARSNYWERGQGAFCYVNRGKRYGLGDWPMSEFPFGQPPCS